MLHGARIPYKRIFAPWRFKAALEDLLVTTVNFPFPTIENCTLGGHGDRDVHAVAHRYNSSSECSPT